MELKIIRTEPPRMDAIKVHLNINCVWINVRNAVKYFAFEPTAMQLCSNRIVLGLSQSWPNV